MTGKSGAELQRCIHQNVLEVKHTDWIWAAGTYRTAGRLPYISNKVK